MNKTIIMGNLGADPELRSTQNGTAVMNLRVATSERVKKGETWEDHTEWHRVVVWGKRAEGLAKFLTKGSRVLIEGKLRTTSYEKNGEKRYSTEINADEVELCDRRPSGDRDQSQQTKREEYRDPFGG